jgi:CubicO group peptidase (beta-lactamase class C family)
LAVLTGSALERASFPEQLGVSSARLQAYIDDALANDVELHSVMVLRHGKVAAEFWREPYAPNYPHVMYSVSKTITAIAVGFAVAEGHFSVEDRVIDFFPEQKPKKTDKRLEQMTVYHLLTMTSGKDVSIFKSKTGLDWITQFFRSKWGFAPGKGWKYINENMHILLEILRRTTGQTATDFLTSRLYEPLGFGRVPFWETSPTGTEAGGWGLFLKTEELAKVAQCLLNHGKWEGKQLIAEAWAAKMQSKQVDNHFDKKARDECYGYGYCMWQNPIPNSSRMDGMFGQYAIVLPEYDAVFLTTSNEIDEPKARSFIWKHLPGIFGEESGTKPADSVPLAMPQILPPISKPRSAETEQSVTGQVYKIRRPVINNMFSAPLCVLTYPVTQMCGFERGNISNIRFDFDEDSCRFRWTEDGNADNTVVCGMDGTARTSQIELAGTKYTMNVWAFWSDEDTLELHLRPLEALTDRIFSFRFRGGRVRLKSGMLPALPFILRSTLDIFLKPYLPVPALTMRVLRMCVAPLAAFLEPTLFGKAKS